MYWNNKTEKDNKMKKFDIKDLLSKLPGKKKPEPVNTALMRERMQPETIEKLEGIGRELKKRRPRFLGSGHITILGPVACFVPLSIFMVAEFGPLMLLLMIIPLIFTPVFLYLRLKGTEELYERSDFDLGLFHYHSCPTYVGHGKFIFESVLKATVPYVAIALVMTFLFLSWGDSFETIDTSRSRTVSGTVEYVVVDEEYIAIGISGDERISQESGEVIEVEYRLTKFVKYLDESFYTSVEAGDEITLRVDRFSSTGKSSVVDRYVEIFDITEISDSENEYFGKEAIKAGEKENTRALIITFAAFGVYAALCGVAIYLADKYAKENRSNETIALPELV